MSSGQLPDRPPRKRERPGWPKLLLIAGITLTVAGFVLTVGPLTPELGGTDSPPPDEPAGDPSAATAGDEIDDTRDTNVHGDEATGTEDIDDTENTAIRGMIGTMTSGTVAFANEYYATFESALDMLGRMYDDVGTDTAYRMEPA